MRVRKDAVHNGVRMLERFLKDANLTVRGNIFEGGE